MPYCTTYTLQCWKEVMIVDIFALISGRSTQIFTLMLAVGFSWMACMKFRKFLSVSSLLRVSFSFFSYQKWMFRKFLGSPVVRTQCFHCQAWIRALVAKPESYKLHNTVKKIKKASQPVNKWSKDPDSRQSCLEPKVFTP